MSEERKKHISVLKNMLEWMEAASKVASKEERKEAVKYAIASLETDEAYQLEYEQPEFCEDCISRENTVKQICKVAEQLPEPHKSQYIMTALYIQSNKEDFPSVLPKADKPKEKWILKNVETSILKIECPICGFHRNVLNETFAKFNYCPNCGADMRGKE